MLGMLVLGMMNPLTMVTGAAVISLEKLLSRPQPIVYLTGVLAIGAGMALVFVHMVPS